MNLVIFTNYGISTVALCCIARIGQILYEIAIIGERGRLICKIERHGITNF